MRTKNRVSLIGMVGKDAELRTTQGGVPYARFTMATSTGGYKKYDGTDVPEVTQWHNVVCWRNLATAVGKIIKKGMKVDVEGMITYGQYQDQQGQQRLSVEIVADDIVLMTNPNPNRSQAQGQQPIPAQQQQYQAQPAPPSRDMCSRIANRCRRALARHPPRRATLMICRSDGTGSNG